MGASSRAGWLGVAAVAAAMLAVAAATFGIAAAYGATASPASDGPLYNLPEGYTQTIVVDRSNRAYVLVESRSGGVAVVPYLDEDGGQVIIPQE